MRKSFLILMLTALLPLAGFAADTEATVGIWKISYTAATPTDGQIVGFKNDVTASEVTALTIPATLNDTENGHVVEIQSIADNFYTTSAVYTSIVSIDMESATNLTTIGANAFKNCTGLTTVKFGSKLTTVGASAFEGCSSLATVTFQAAAAAQTIAASAFKNTAIVSLDLTNTKVAEINNLFGTTAEVANNTLQTVTIPASMTSIVENAFLNCTNLSTVTFVEATAGQTIGASAFKNTAIVSLDLTNTKVAEINNLFGTTAEVANNTLQTVTIPASMTSIVENAFLNCTNLSTVTFVKATAGQTIGSSAFKNTAIEHLNLANTEVTTINNLFGTDFTTPVKNTTLTTVTFPATAWTTVEGAFENCTALLTVNFTPKTGLGTQILGDRTFLGSIIQDLDFTNSTIQTIPSNLLRHDTYLNYNLKLKTVKMPKSLTTIKTKAFYNCTVLNSVDFTANACTNLATIENFAFGTTPSLTALDFSACSAMVDFGDAVQPFVPAADGVNTELTSIILPTTTTNIGIAMKNLRVLSTLKAGTGTSLEQTAITKILTDAFTNDKALTSLSLPNTVVTIVGTPFEGCTALASLTIDGTALTTLGTEATALFGTTDVLTSLTISGATAVDIKKGVLTNQTGLATVSIAAGNDFKGTIGSDAAAITIADGGSLTLGNLGTAGNAATLNDGGIAVGDGTNVTVGNIVNLTALTEEPIDGDVAKLVIGDITQDLSAAAKALVNGSIDELEVGALTNTKLDIFGQAAKITFKGAITAIVAPTTPNAALTELDFGTLALAAGVIVADAFNVTNAANLTTVTWTPAAATKAFADNAFGDGTGRKVTLTTTTAVGEAYTWTLNNVTWNAEAKQIEITVAQKDGQYWYGKHYNATENYKIAKEAEDGATVIVYGAYVDQYDKAIYMEQLHIINGYYWIPKNVPVVVKSTTATAVTADKYITTESSMNLFDATHYVSEISYLDAETAGTALMNNTNDINWSLVTPAAEINNTNYDLYAMAKPEKHNIKWLSFKASTTLPAGTFYVRCEKDAAPARGELTVIWTDGSEETTGIENVNNADLQNDGMLYNMQGIRVNAPVKGQIYIQNGKKFMMK